MRIDQHQLADEPGPPQIARYHRADRTGARAGADQCNGSRIEQLVEITNRHGVLSMLKPGQQCDERDALCGDSQSLRQIVDSMTEGGELRVVDLPDVYR